MWINGKSYPQFVDNYVDNFFKALKNSMFSYVPKCEYIVDNFFKLCKSGKFYSNNQYQLIQILHKQSDGLHSYIYVKNHIK